MVHLIASERSITGNMVRLWQRDHYHYEIDTEGHSLQIYQPVEEAMIAFKDIINGYPISWIIEDEQLSK